MKWIPKFRFSLRTLFVVTTLLGVFLVPLVVRLDKSRQQKEAVAWVLEHGGTVYYGGAYGEDEDSSSMNLMASGKNALDASGTPITAFGPPAATPNPFISASPPPPRAVSWIEDFLGTDFFYPVVKLELRYCEETDISPIRQFTQLMTLDLSDTQVTDLKPLANSKSLKSINLSYTDISDLSSLSELSNLESINLENTLVKDLRPLANLSHLKKIDLSSSAVTDLAPLANNPMLSNLTLDIKNLSDLSPLSQFDSLRIIQFSDFHEELQRISERAEDQVLTKLTKNDVDYSPLFQLQNLELIMFSASKISKSKIEEIKLAMPNCEVIIWDPTPIFWTPAPIRR